MKTGEQIEFGQRLRRLREARDLSMADLAARVGLSYTYIRQLETGSKRIPHVDRLNDLARVLGVSVAALIGEAAPPPAPVDYRALLDEIRRTASAGIAAIETELQSDRAQSPVRYLGRVPADTVRWIEAREAGAMEDVWDAFLAGRSPESCFTVRVSGDCLMADGIIDGTMVLCAWANGRQPAQGAIALVRFSDEFTLKHWYREGDWVELRDGAGQMIHRFSIAAEFEVVGHYLTHWRAVQPPR